MLVAFTALSAGMLPHDKAMFIQIATIVSLVVSTYWVVMKYPTTIAGDPSLRRG